jgi:hypothetical protein
MRALIPMLCLAVLMAACGPRWVYTNLDWLIPWYVDDYVALDTQQDSALAARLKNQLDWHCRTQMPRYADFLRQLRDDLSIPGQPLRADAWGIYFEQLRQYWINLIRQIGPDAAAIVMTATDEQIDELFANLEKTNLEMQDKYVDPALAERRQNRRKRIEKRIEYWTGPLNPAQVSMLTEWSQALEEIADDWLAHRRDFQRGLRRLLESRRQADNFQEKFIDLLAHPEALRDPGYQAKIDANLKRTFLLLERLSATLTPVQRRHTLSRLEQLAAEMDQLACEPAPSRAESAM